MTAPRAYYNEFDPYAAAWLRNLIAGGHIAPGDVDERSIVDVRPADLDGYTQCHFFAGIGGWSYAARLAGWPDSRPIWTGSCPCQPFSSAGQRQGFRDPRHLWPEWFRLIAAKHPAAVFGEQISVGGASWLAGVRRDLEAEAYVFGAIDIDAQACGWPQARERLYFMAGRIGFRLEEQGLPRHLDPLVVRTARAYRNGTDAAWACEDGRVRRAQSGVLPVAPRLPGWVGKVRAYGNAIVPQVAAEVIRAFLDAEADEHLRLTGADE